jgi:hypothetical protein
MISKRETLSSQLPGDFQNGKSDQVPIDPADEQTRALCLQWESTLVVLESGVTISGRIHEAVINNAARKDSLLPAGSGRLDLAAALDIDCRSHRSEGTGQ